LFGFGFGVGWVGAGDVAGTKTNTLLLGGIFALQLHVSREKKNILKIHKKIHRIFFQVLPKQNGQTGPSFTSTSVEFKHKQL